MTLYGTEEQIARAKFQHEIKDLWDRRNNYWPIADQIATAQLERPDVQMLLNSDLGSTLDCNDIQFQLCEADKFWRALDVFARFSNEGAEKCLKALSGKKLRLFVVT